MKKIKLDSGTNTVSLHGSLTEHEGVESPLIPHRHRKTSSRAPFWSFGTSNGGISAANIVCVDEVRTASPVSVHSDGVTARNSRHGRLGWWGLTKMRETQISVRCDWDHLTATTLEDKLKVPIWTSTDVLDLDRWSVS